MEGRKRKPRDGKRALKQGVAVLHVLLKESCASGESCK